MKVIISGGGTGGHVFPAIAIADALKKEDAAIDILFVGAKGRIEMDKVPNAGYKIVGLDIMGFQRRLTWKNLLFPYKLMMSLLHARNIVKKFMPDLVIGVGGYASGPVLKVASWMGIPIFLQEQNSFAGVTNKLLGQKAENVFVANEGMDKFFDSKKIILAGNPVREEIYSSKLTREEARLKFHLDARKKTILIFGGSLGARKLNDAIEAQYDLIAKTSNIQLLWQVGKLYYDEFKMGRTGALEHVKVIPFIDDMAAAYIAADVVVCRAGALTISELMAVKKAAILVPSPNVAEDHQTHNAMVLVRNGAALMIKDDEAAVKLAPEMYRLMDDDEKRKEIEKNVGAMAKYDAASTVAKHLIEFYRKKKI